MTQDTPSNERIKNLNPKLQPIITECINHFWNNGIKIRVVQGLRTIEYQNSLYEQGRNKPGKIVTNSKGGQSAHNYGIAVDLCVMKKLPPKEDKDLDFNIQNYPKIVEFLKSRKLEWGGDFRTFKDYPHFSLPLLSNTDLAHNTIENNVKTINEKMKTFNV